MEDINIVSNDVNNKIKEDRVGFMFLLTIDLTYLLTFITTVGINNVARKIIIT